MFLHVMARVALILGFFSSTSFAAEYSTLNSSVRALGMGDAYTALADDHSALFYNPAGLARVRGLNWKVFGLKIGASGYEAYKKMTELDTSGSGYADAINDLYGEKAWLGAGVESIFSMPMFAFGIYDHAHVLLKVDNPVNPQVNANIINDYGYTAGFGVPIGPFLHTGVALRYVKRSGGELPFGAGSLADLDSDAIVNRIRGWGVGYGADIGVNVFIPAPMFNATLAAAWRNVGQTSFRSGDPNTKLPTEDNDITLGAGLVFDLPLISIAPAVDFRYLNRDDLQLTRKINFGIEIGLPLLDIRGGFHEGYYTAGAGVNLGLFRIDAATYGVELGEYPGQIEDRRYVLEFVMDIGLGNFSVAGAGAGSSASGGGSKSSWGGRRLKQRR